MHLLEKLAWAQISKVNIHGIKYKEGAFFRYGNTQIPLNDENRTYIVLDESQ
jgi:hypothetical protein